MKWVQLPQSGDAPGGRSSHSLTAIGDYLYLIGGENTPRVPVGSDVYRCSPGGEWTKLQVKGTAPSARVAHKAAAVGGKIWIFGGRQGIEMGEGALSDLHVFDTATARWEEVQAVSGTPPPARSYHTMAAVGTKLYIFGGCGASGRLNDLHCFDTESRTWRELPSSDRIPPRGGSTLTPSADGRHLYVIGGFCGHELGDYHRFDLQSSTWQCPACCSGQPTLPPRSVFIAAVHTCAEEGCGHAGHPLVFGGEVDPSDQGHSGAGGFSADVFCMCGEGGWVRQEVGGDAPGPRGWFAATVSKGGRLVVHGGIDDANVRLAGMFTLEMH